MASSSDWIAQAGRIERAGPGWVAALALGGEQTGGFRDVSPFLAAPAAPLENSATAEPAPEISHQEDAETRAYSKGFADGYGEAERAATAALAQSKEQFGSLRLAFQRLDAGARQALANDLDATVRALCAQVLGDYALDGKALLSRCENAAQRLGGGPADLVLHLHPETRALMDETALADWNITEDGNLAPGALRLTSADGAVRDGPEDWDRAIAEALGS